MVTTRRSREVEEDRRVHDDSNAHPSDSDSDDAPEEVTLSHSKTKALHERQQERLVQKEQKQKDKEKRNRRLKAARAEKETAASEEDLDLLPDTVLQAITAGQDEGSDDNDARDRRVQERRIVSEQLRHGIMQGKKKRKFQEKRVGPVRVTTLNAQSYSSTGSEEAKAFLEKKLAQRHARSYSGRPSLPKRQATYTYF